LLADLGAILLRGVDVFKDGEMDNLRDRARNWLDRNRDTLQKRLCGDQVLNALTGDSALEAAAVADYIAKDLLNKPGAFTVNAILVKQGLKSLCEDLALMMIDLVPASAFARSVAGHRSRCGTI